MNILSGDFKAAEELYLSAIRIAPLFINAYTNLGEIYHTDLTLTP